MSAWSIFIPKWRKTVFSTKIGLGFVLENAGANIDETYIVAQPRKDAEFFFAQEQEDAEHSQSPPSTRVWRTAPKQSAPSGAYAWVPAIEDCTSEFVIAQSSVPPQGPLLFREAIARK